MLSLKQRKATCNPSISFSQRSFVAMTFRRANTALLRSIKPYTESERRFQQSLDHWLDLRFKTEDARMLEEAPKVIEEAGKRITLWVNARFRRRNIPVAFEFTHR